MNWLKSVRSRKLFWLTFLAFTLIFCVCNCRLNKNNNFVSHSNEPNIGDKIRNNNPSCKHYDSIGRVTSIKTLKGESGKTITYKVDNDGSTYCKGQLLNKTMDQLTKY